MRNLEKNDFQGSLPKLLVGALDYDLQIENLKFEPIEKNGRASAEVHWLFKPEEANGSAAAVIRYFAGGDAPLHLHTGFELIYMLEGSMQTSTGEVSKNDLILLKPDSIHKSCSKAGCLALIIWQQSVKMLN